MSGWIYISEHRSGTTVKVGETRVSSEFGEVVIVERGWIMEKRNILIIAFVLLLIGVLFRELGISL